MVENIITSKWEYKVVSFSIDELEEMGKDGWELVAVDNVFMYFKRPLLMEEEYELRWREGIGIVKVYTGTKEVSK